ncbi:MAG: phosphoribosylglycinamide formyltransferase [Shimia sp.]
MNRVAILISGGGSNMAALVDAMRARGYATPAKVISNVPGAGGLERARARGVATATIDHRAFPGRQAFEAALTAELSGIDTICLAGFMRILTPGFVAPWAGRMLNVHPSLLPRHPGLDTHARALAAGDAEHGATVHLVTPDLDAGPILGQVRLRVRADDTPATLAARLLPLEHRLYPEALRRHLTGGAVPFALPNGA